jgi:ketosteroid isomerase-like protein
MPNRTYAAFKRVAPYFDLARGALGDLVDGAHFFDVVDEETVYEVLYDLGWPRVIRGRTALMAAFRGYAESVELHGADHLVKHEADGGRVVVIEYEVHGTIRATGVAYDNRFCSVIHVDQRKIAHWRDYMDSHAAWKALNARSSKPTRRSGR